MSDSITIINEGDQKVVKVVRLTRPDEGGGFDAATLAATIHAATEKVTIADDDEVAIADSAATYGLKRWKWSTIKATLKTYFDTIYTTSAAVATQISNAITALSLGNSATRNVGTTSGTVAAGDDSRLSDARTPTAHKTSHATGGADAIAPSDIGAANASHTHVQADVTGLTTTSSPQFSSASARGTAVNGFDVYYGTTRVGYISSIFGTARVALSGDIYLAPAGQDVNNADIRISRTSAEGIQVTDFGGSNYRNVIARDFQATRFLRPASYTVAAANALVGVPTGAIVDISNESGGATPARYDGSNWKRLTDLATIS